MVTPCTVSVLPATCDAESLTSHNRPPKPRIIEVGSQHPTPANQNPQFRSPLAAARKMGVQPPAAKGPAWIRTPLALASQAPSARKEHIITGVLYLSVTVIR
jgi:hypothetical protein